MLLRSMTVVFSIISILASSLNTHASSCSDLLITETRYGVFSSKLSDQKRGLKTVLKLLLSRQLGSIVFFRSKITEMFDGKETFDPQFLASLLQYVYAFSHSSDPNRILVDIDWLWNSVIHPKRGRDYSETGPRWRRLNARGEVLGILPQNRWRELKTIWDALGDLVPAMTKRLTEQGEVKREDLDRLFKAAKDLERLLDQDVFDDQNTFASNSDRRDRFKADLAKVAGSFGVDSLFFHLMNFDQLFVALLDRFPEWQIGVLRGGEREALEGLRGFADVTSFVERASDPIVITFDIGVATVAYFVELSDSSVFRARHLLTAVFRSMNPVERNQLHFSESSFSPWSQSEIGFNPELWKAISHQGLRGAPLVDLSNRTPLRNQNSAFDSIFQTDRGKLLLMTFDEGTQ